MKNKRYSVEWGGGEETAMLGNLLSRAKQHLQQVKQKAIEEVPDDIAPIGNPTARDRRWRMRASRRDFRIGAVSPSGSWKSGRNPAATATI